jgi:hypothetical protein
MTKQTFYMWSRALLVGLFPAPLFYSFYLLEWMTPRPGFEDVFDTFFFGGTITFVITLVITFAALIYNAYIVTRRERQNGIQ